MNWFLDPLQFPFMRDAMLIGAVVAAMCAMLSCFVILKGWSLMGDAISHAVLPGIVLAYLAGIPLAVGAFGSGFTCALATGFIRHNSRIKEDTVLGVVFTGLFAIGLVLHSRTQSELHLDHILFGSIFGIEPDIFRQVLWTGGIVIAAMLMWRRDLLLTAFDPSQARVLGLPVKLLDYGLLSLLVLAVVAALQAVGIVLVIAMLITPGCTAYLWTDRFDRMMLIAVATAVFSTLVGIVVAFHLDSAGACIVLVQAVVFVISFLLAPKYGLLSRKFRRAA
ncbi:MAG: metal ABC transporter permease [Verrucomicrobiota bacterium]